jgi:hypothetical protein
VVVEEVVGVLVTNNIADIGPSVVEEGKNRESQHMGAERLQDVLVRRNRKVRDTHILSSNTGVDKDLDQSDNRVDSKLVQDEELCVPALGENLITCGRCQQVQLRGSCASIPGMVASCFGIKMAQWMKVTIHGYVTAAV